MYEKRALYEMTVCMIFLFVRDNCSPRPWGNGEGIDGNDVPGYTLIVWPEHRPAKFVRAVVPDEDVQQKLGILKLMFEERDILGMLHDDASFDDFWAGVNSVCDSQYAVIAANCTELSIRVRDLRDFSIATSAASLDASVMGQEVRVILVDPTNLVTGIFETSDWHTYIDAMFAHMYFDAISPRVKAKLGPAQKKILRSFNKPNEKARIKMTNEQACERLEAGVGRHIRAR